MREMDLLVRLGQRSDSPVHAGRGPIFWYRHAYTRSADSADADEPGQDYLAYREMGASFIFAVCDGVSMSFFGDLAARIVGDGLVKWLAEREPAAIDQFHAEMSAYLSDTLPPAATEAVDAYPYTVDIDMLREHLERRRAQGSEAMFICGRLDRTGPRLPDGRIVLAWMGDMRLALWRARGRVDLGDTFQTRQRWSTRHGLINGPLNVYGGPLDDPDNPITRLVAYSDGLALLDDLLDAGLTDARLQELVASTHNQSESDDGVYLEVWPAPADWAESGEPTAGSQLPLPTGPREQHAPVPATPAVDRAYLLLAGLLGLLLGLIAGALLMAGQARR